MRIAQLSYHAQLPNGQPITLQIGIVKDDNYAAALHLWVSLLSQALEDLKIIIANTGAN